MVFHIHSIFVTYLYLLDEQPELRIKNNRDLKINSKKDNMNYNSAKSNHKQEMQSYEDEIEHQSQEVMIEDEPDPDFQNTIYESRDEMKK